MTNFLGFRVDPVFSIMLASILDACQLFPTSQKIIVTHLTVCSFCFKFRILRLVRMHSESFSFLFSHHSLVLSYGGFLSTAYLTLSFDVTADHVPSVSEHLILLHEAEGFLLLLFDMSLKSFNLFS